MSLKFINVVYIEGVYIKSFWYIHRWYNLYTPRLSENVRTYFVHTRGLTYTPSRLSLVYIINAQCEPRFRFYYLNFTADLKL